MSLRPQFEKYRLFLTAWIAGHLLYSAMLGVRYFLIEPGREEALPSILHGLMHVGFGVVPAIPCCCSTTACAAAMSRASLWGTTSRPAGSWLAAG